MSEWESMGSPIEFTTRAAGADVELIPEGPLPLGEHMLSHRNLRCSGSAELTVVESAELPISLGTIEASAPRSVEAHEMCLEIPEDTLLHESALTVSLSDDAMPWIEAFQYELVIDDRATLVLPNEAPFLEYDRSARIDRRTGTVRAPIFAVCAGRSNGAVSSGEHTVKMRARLLGSDVVVESDEVFVELKCDPLSCSVGTPTEHAPMLVLLSLLLFWRQS